MKKIEKISFEVHQNPNNKRWYINLYVNNKKEGLWMHYATEKKANAEMTILKERFTRSIIKRRF